MLTSKLLLVYVLSTANMVGVDVDTSKIDPEQAYCMAQNIYYEAKSENKQGQFAVASVTLNRVNDARFPNTICGVVKQSTMSVASKRLVCAFSWYCENDKRGKEIPVRNKDGSINTQVAEQFKAASIVAIKAMSGSVTDVTRGATHFHNPSVSQPAWTQSLKKTVSLGQHDFYKLPVVRRI
jgi:spore germination cell wall hydrolase CwlJ-like protein